MSKPSWDGLHCYYPKCQSKIVSSGLCDRHYRRLKKHGWGDNFFRERHGERQSPEYRVWCHIKGRCLNPSDRSFKHYGGRGILICPEWENDFSLFLRDMGRRPTDSHQIDRINNELGYFPGNCRWTVSAVNNQNRRSTKLSHEDVLEIRMSSGTGKEISLKYGISISQALRVKNGKRWRTMENQA